MHKHNKLLIFLHLQNYILLALSIILKNRTPFKTGKRLKFAA
tara:strand:- start:1342 stop:1467 length:126 start_codon:yes stop_codon:yes gene_type:complete